MTTPSWLSRSLRSFLFSSSVYSFHLSLISSTSVRFFTVSVLYCAHLGMKVSFDSSNFLEEISNLFPFCFPLYLCIVHTERPSCLSLLSSGALCLVGCTFSFLLCFLLLFFLKLLVKPPQTIPLPSCFSFYLGCFCSLPPVQYYRPLSIVLQRLCLLDLIPLIYSSPPLCIHRDFNYTWPA